MPLRAPSTCRKPGCPGLFRNGVCTVCGPKRGSPEERIAQQKLDRERGSSASRGYGYNWRKLREIILSENPLCVECLKHGQVVSATDVDHIIPKRDGGGDTLENLQPLCHECHSRKTFGELKPVDSVACTSQVILVCGPPGSGKTTYVRDHKRTDDVVIDVDALVAALTLGPWYEKTPQVLRIALDVRDYLIDRMMRSSEIARWWLITSEADSEKRRALALRTKASTVYVIETSALECMRRIRNDERRESSAALWDDIIRRWWNTYQRNDGETAIAEG